MTTRQMMLFNLIAPPVLAVILLSSPHWYSPFEVTVLITLLVGMVGIQLLPFRRFSFQMQGWWSGFMMWSVVFVGLYAALAVVIKPVALLVSGGVYAYLIIFAFLPLWFAITGRTQFALRYFNTLLHLFPSSTRLLEQRGTTYMLLNDYENALDDFDTALSRLRDKKDSDQQKWRTILYGRRLEAYLKLRDFERALDEADLVVKLKPDDAYSYGQRSVALLQLGMYKDAWADVEKAQTLAGDTPYWQAILQNTRGLLHYIDGKADLALTEYENGLSLPLHPNEARYAHPILYTNIAFIHFGRGDYAAMQVCYDQGAQADPNSIHVRLGQALLHQLRGNPTAAAELWRGLIAENKRFADAEWVIPTYIKWTPDMADTIRQIVAEAATAP
jgi:tetratricopeptide (TPR) repeat protein